MLLYVLAAEIMFRNIGTKYLQTRFVAVNSSDPDEVELSLPGVCFRFCKITYRDPGKPVRLARECSQGYHLETVDRLELVMPEGVEFAPQRYFHHANLITLEDARSGGYLRDKEAEHWMEKRGLDRCIRGSDGHYYRATSDSTVLEEAVIV